MGDGIFNNIIARFVTREREIFGYSPGIFMCTIFILSLIHFAHADLVVSSITTLII